MGLFDLFGLGDTFDYDGDGKTGLWDAFVALEWFGVALRNLYNQRQKRFIIVLCEFLRKSRQ